MYPNEYILYLVHFHGDRDYFECHEILEEYWKKQDPGNKHSIWVGLIQLAVSCYHHRRSNYAGAKKTLKKAINIFLNEDQSLKRLGLNKKEMLSLLKEQYLVIEKKQPYNSFNFPILDPLLIEQCKSLCTKLGFIWCTESNVNSNILVHRHKLRNRTSIIQARYNALKTKKGSE